jgi:hypothetical protein
MKNIYSLISILCISPLCAQIIDIPDAAFKSKLLSGTRVSVSTAGNTFNTNADTNDDGEIDVNEALLVTGLNLSTTPANTNGDVTSLEGIQYFTNLKYLNFTGNQVSGTFDATIFPNLIDLYCNANNLTGLNVSGLGQLISLRFHDNDVAVLDTEGLNSLETLFFRGNNIANIDLNNTPNLKNLYISGNNINSLNVSMLQALEVLMCENSNVSELILGANPSLIEIVMPANNLSSVDLTGLQSLNWLNVAANSISDIDISVVPQMRQLEISGNPIEEIDLSNSLSLEYLFINNTLVSTIDCSATNIMGLHASDNLNLVSINVKNEVTSFSDPDMLFFTFMFENLPLLTSICIDNGEQNNLIHTDYNSSGNVVVYTGENCEEIAAPASRAEYELNLIKLYPNPVSNYLNIDADRDVDSLYVYTTEGKMIKSLQSESGINQIDVSDLASGFYIINVTIQNKVYTGKILKN